MLRVGMVHNGQEVTQRYIDWLFPQLEVLCKRGQLWGYNRIPDPKEAPHLLRSLLSHHVVRVHKLHKSLWVDIEPLTSAPGKDLESRIDASSGAHLRALGVPTGSFKIIAIDIYQLNDADQATWADFIQEISNEKGVTA